MTMTTDSICAKYAEVGVKLTVRDLGDDVVLIQGNSVTLRFLGELLVAHAEGIDTGFQLSPTGEGNALFASDATKGLYLNRIV